MNIKMIGIDYSRAAVGQREIFSFTKLSAQKAEKIFIEKLGASGCIILSTCNRTEVWVSYNENGGIGSIYEVLCSIKGIEQAGYKEYFKKRSGKEAVEYLFELCCGIKSQVFGEDQILSQVKEAVFLSRECSCIDTVLEVLFRIAITAAKKVKSKVRLNKKESSIAFKIIQLLKEMDIDLNNCKCMVIGNGEIGRLMVSELVKNGVDVSMTLRQYKHREAVIPAGCRVINYDDRVSYISSMDVIVSATISPHYTITFNSLKKVGLKKEIVFIDLSVPRDIEPTVSNLKFVKLIDMDKLGIDDNTQHRGQVLCSKKILNEYIEDFKNWYYFRELIPIVKSISNRAAKEIEQRTEITIKGLNINKDDKNTIQKIVNNSSFKVIAKLIYGLKDNLDVQRWEECIDSLNLSSKGL